MRAVLPCTFTGWPSTSFLLELFVEMVHMPSKLSVRYVAEVLVRRDRQQTTVLNEIPMETYNHIDNGELACGTNAVIDWEDDPHNPLNWPTWRKVHLVVMLATMAFLA